MKRLTFILSFVIFSLLGAISQTPKTLNYQGFLTDNTGQAVADGSQNITFSIYDVSTGGTALWTETNSITTEDGLFSVVLGESTAINLSFDRQYWLGITVAGSELTPRTVMASVPYSSNIPRTAFVKDVKAQGTQGGTFTSGAWQTRDLNTVEGDNTIVSVSGNQFTLGAGTYIIEASAPAYSAGLHKIRLQNITDSSTEIYGSSAYTTSGDHSVTESFINGQITITAQKTFEIQHRGLFTVNTNGFGGSTGFGDEVYTIVKITKISN